MHSAHCLIEKSWLQSMILLLSMVLSSYIAQVEAFSHVRMPHALSADMTSQLFLLRKSVAKSTVYYSTRTDDEVSKQLWGKDNEDSGTTGSSSSSSNSWSVTDNWNQLSQSDNINYNYGGTDNDTGDIVVLNSIDQVTLAALRMQNFGMSSNTVTATMSEEEMWIQNSIQQIMVMDDTHDDDEDDVSTTKIHRNVDDTSMGTNVNITAATLNTEHFLDEMGKEIAMLVRCNDNDKNSPGGLLFMDECEILDDAEFTASTTTDKQGKSSYERVELLQDGVPIWMKDGEFVFIDEQSCIGCMQCASAAPGSFQMLEQGRARTFCQRNSPDVNSAVASCPVDCMHYVSFDELKELEIARDVGVADDHRHFGHSSARGYIPPTPLHISRRDSDANHKSSFYHFIQDKCSKSTSCPKRGCYDCPKFAPGKNPYFQEKLLESTHVRAEYFKETGTADAYRKTVDL